MMQSFYTIARGLGISVGLLLIGTCQRLPVQTKDLEINTPEVLYGDLFYDVQYRHPLFADSKTFVDCIPLLPPKEIKKLYAALQPKDSLQLSAFVKRYFKIPVVSDTYVTDSSSIQEHITSLWEVLKRPADPVIPGTLLPLPKPYVVPGGRFREVYYWDSYFTMLGLEADGQIETIGNLLDNFTYLIQHYGFIPNGNRTYYLSRSQPPFYSLMVDLWAGIKGDSMYVKYLDPLEKEYLFWMDGASRVSPNRQAHRRVVLLPDNNQMNRYWDDADSPRSESYLEDLLTAQEAARIDPHKDKNLLYRDLRAAAESGWDFSSRWLRLPQDLYSIHTTEILPVDLNCLLYHMETVLAKAYRLKGDSLKANLYAHHADTRAAALQQYCWSAQQGFFMDYDFVAKRSTAVFSLAALYPLFFKIADAKQAALVQQKVASEFLKEGGLTCTLTHTAEQWDAPNGWAPLHWITVQALRNYGYTQLAQEIKQRWMKHNSHVYQETYKMMEKYNVEDLSRRGGGGEYPTQDGFGWTNGVYQKFAKEE